VITIEKIVDTCHLGNTGDYRQNCNAWNKHSSKPKTSLLTVVSANPSYCELHGNCFQLLQQTFSGRLYRF